MVERLRGDRLADLKLRGMILVIVSLAAATALVGAIVVRVVNPGIGSFGDALWWAVTTVTTTGFGDVVPTDSAGRLVGIVLMMVGISLIPTVTSLIVAVFIAQRTRETTEQDRVHREAIMQRLDDLDALLSELARPGV